MQTTLLGLGIALILALLAALVGPYFVDWNGYRADFEREASRLAGVPVRVSGAIDVRLLPTPSLILRDIELGSSSGNIARARALGVEFALTPLIRGQFRADQLRVIAPELSLGLDRDGKIAAPGISMSFDPDILSIDQLIVEDARVALYHAVSGTRAILDKIWFQGDVKSLAGQFRGEGAFVYQSELYGFRIAGTRPDDGGLKIKFSLDPSEKPLHTEGEGVLSFENGSPRFEGQASVSRAVGVVTQGRATVNEPMRVSTRIKASVNSALLEQIDFQYGAPERAINLSGAAEIKFGARPRLDGVLSGRQVDLDRLLASTDNMRKLPLAAFQSFAGLFGESLRPPVSGQIGISIDGVTIGGATLQTVRADLTAGDGHWSLDNVEFRAPGFTQVFLSGRLDLTAEGLAFAGPVDITATDPAALAAWLQGRQDAPAVLAKSFRARGEVTLSRERMAVERLRAEIDRKSVEGRLSYVWPRGDQKARVDGELRAAELDIDNLLDFGGAAFGGVRLERPGEVNLSVDVERARLAGFDAQDAAIKFNLRHDKVLIERFQLGDFGGASVSAQGEIDLGTPPRGNMTAKLDLRDWSGLISLANRFAPQFADQLRLAAERIGAANLRAIVATKEIAANNRETSVTVDGSAGATTVALSARVVGDSTDLAKTTIRAESRLDAGDDGALLSLLGLARHVAASQAPGHFSVAAEGPIGGELRLQSEFKSPALAASLKGSGRFSLAAAFSGAFDLQVARGNLRFPGGKDNRSQLPFSGRTRVSMNAGQLSLSDVAATVGSTPVRGAIEIALGESARISGNLSADFIDFPAILAAVSGASDRANAWSTEPFAGGFFPNATGAIHFRALKTAVTSQLTAEAIEGEIRFAPDETSFDKLEGKLAGGRLSSAITLRKNENGLSLRHRIQLRDADAALLFSAYGRELARGRLTVNAELEGAGLAPKTVLGSLHGSGSISLSKGQVAALNPDVFKGAMRAADQGLKLDLAAVRGVVMPLLEKAPLTIPLADGSFTISNGHLRLPTMIVRGEGAELAMSGNLDLTSSHLDLRLVLAGTGETTSAGRPELTVLLKGPVAAPERSVDVATLAGWLALRSVEQQARRLEEIESAAQPAVIPPSPPAPIAAPPTSPPAAATPSAPAASRTAPSANPNSAPGMPSSPPAAVARPRTPAPVRENEARGSTAEQAPPLPPPLEIRPLIRPRAPL